MIKGFIKQRRFLPSFLTSGLSLLLMAVSTGAAERPRMTYSLGSSSDSWPADKKAAVIAAMDSALANYNRYGVFDKKVTAYYNASVPTANGSYNGTINFGGQIGTRVAQHELGHVLGSGQYYRWPELMVNGVWQGDYAQAQLKELDGPSAEMHGDSIHFWPYGLNYDSEFNSSSARKNVLMTAAWRRDMGIGYVWPPVNGPANGTYRLTPKHATDKALRVIGGTTNGAAIDIAAYTGSIEQQFLLERQPDGTYEISTAQTGSRNVELPSGNVAIGTAVKLYDDNSGDAQKWVFEPNGDGYYRITAKSHLLRLLEAAGAGTTDGTLAQIGDYTGTTSDSQFWKLEPVAGAPNQSIAYWNGDVDGLWTTNNSGNTNWATGYNRLTDLGRTPDALTNVFFPGGTANRITTLGQDFSIPGLIFDGSADTTISGTHNLTLGANGLTMGFLSGAVTIDTSGQIILSAPQAWTNSSNNNLTVACSISGTAALTLAGSGTTIFARDNSYAGGTTLSAGALQIGNGGTTGSILGDVTNNGTLTFNRSDTVTFDGNISGSGSVVKNGTGTLRLSRSNSYSGGTTNTGGALAISNGSALGSGALSFTNDGGGVGKLQVSNGITVSNAININGSGTGSSTSGVIESIGDNTLNGNITWNTKGGSNTSVVAQSGTLTLGGTVTTADPVTGARTFYLGGDGSLIANGVIKNGTATVSVSKGGGGVLRLNGTNLYTGGTTLSSGRLDIGNNAALGTGSLSINGGTLVPRGGGRSLSNPVIVGGDFTLHDVAGLNNSLTLSGPMNLGGTSRTITVSEAVNGVDTTLSGVISNGALTKAGPGTLVLSGNNTYSGDTTVSAGALLLGAANVIADSSNLTLSGGTFATGGFNETLGTLSLTEDSTLDLGAGTSTLTYSGVGTFADGKTLTITNWTEGSDHLFIGSSALLTPTQLAQIKFGALGAQQLSTGEVVPAAGLPAGITVTPTSGLVTSEAGGTASFTVKLNSQPTADVTLTLSSSDTTEGTVAPASLTFTAANWDTAQTVTVTGADDNVDDDDIAYTIVTAPATSTDAAYDTLDASDVAITNTDDEGLPALSINDVTGQEAYSGTTDATFTLSLSHPSTKTISVNYATANGSATAGSDYTAKSGTLTLPAGSTSATLTIAITGDTTTEGDQTFLVNLSAPVNATLGDGQGQGIIQDSPPLVPVVIIKTPLPDQKMLISAFKSGSLSGTANDNLGVTKVEVKITRLRGGVVQTWNGTTFATTSVRVPATITGSGTKVSWALSTAFPPQAQLDEGEYIVVVYATDADGNSGSATTRLTLYPGDTQAPVAQIFTPTLNQKILLSTFTSGAANTLSGNALDNVGINSLRLRFSRKRNGVNQYWNGSAFTTLGLFLSATVTPVGSTSPKWNLDSQMPPLSALDSGLYQIEAYAVDIAGNKSPTLTRPFTLGTDFTAPSVAIVAPTQGQKMALNTLVAGTVNGTAGDNLGVVSVKVKLMRKRGTVTTYWNGSAFTSTTATVDAVVTTVGGTSVTWQLDQLPTAAQGLDTGSYTLYAAAYDAAGNTRSSASRSFYLINPTNASASDNVSAPAATYAPGNATSAPEPAPSAKDS